METPPFDLSVSNADLHLASLWWDSLSINQMKAFRNTYCPSQSWTWLSQRWVHQIWETEEKPAPGKTAWQLEAI